MKTCSILLLTIFLLSCSKEIEVEIPAEKASLVVMSTIGPATFPNIIPLRLYLQSSLPIFDTTPNPIGNAVVLYYENNQLKDTLRYIAEMNSYLITKTIADFPIPGNTYSIQVQKEGYESVSASTIVPSKVKIADAVVIPVAYFDEDGHVHSEIDLRFEDPVEESNFYEVAVTDITNYGAFELTTNDPMITSESYYPTHMQFDVRPPKSLLFSDKSINGEKHKLILYYSPPQGNVVAVWIRFHYITIHLRNVTEDYYKYRTTLIQHLNSKEADILYGTGEPINAISNINNGYGLFAGYNTDSLIVRK
jgi:Domain of unknown function (DUF4249)